MADLAEMLNGLTAIQNGASPDAVPPLTPQRKSFGPVATLLGDRADRILAATVPEVAKLPALPFDLYRLADAGVNLGSNYLGFGDTHLPGAEGAKEISDAITVPVQKFQDRLAGEPIKNDLLTSDRDQAIGSWSRLGLTTLLTAPAALTAKITQGAEALKTGVTAIDKTGEIALKTAEVLSPVIMRQGTPATAALNFGIPAALGVGLELAFPDQEKAKLDAQADLSTKQAISGIETSAQAAQVSDAIQGKPQTVTAGVNGLPNTNISGYGPVVDWAIIGVLSAASIASNKREVFGRIVDAVSAKTGAKSVMGGLRPEDATTLSAGQVFRANVIDDMAPIKDTMRKVYEDLGRPNAGMMADRWEARVASSHGSAIDTKVQSVHEFGDIPGSNVRLPPTNDLYNVVKTLDPASYKILQDGMNERINANVFGPVAPNNGAWAAVQADPKLRAIADMYQQTVHGVVDYLVEQKYMTQNAANTIKRRSPEGLLPSAGKEDSHLSMLLNMDRLKPGGGVGTMNDPIRELPGFIERSIRLAEANHIRRTFINAMDNARLAGLPWANDIIGRKNVKLVGKDAENVVHYRDHLGLPQHVEIKDAVIRRALQNADSIARLQALSGTAAWFARHFQSSATGSIAAAIGQPFAFTSMLYSAGIGTVMRPVGIATSHLDKAVQSLSGGRFGVRGDIVGNLAAALPQAARGVSAVLAQRAASALHKSVVTHGIIANKLGPQTAERLAQGLSNHYKRSWVHYFQQEGLLGPATTAGVDAAATIKDINGRLLATNTPKVVIQDTLRFVNDILHAVSASPTAAVLSLNKGKDKHLVNRAIREFTGDPAKGGAFQGRVGESIGKLTAATPWGNIFWQSSDRLVRELARNPVKTLSGMTVAVGIPTITATLWNTSLGHEFSDYQFNKRNADRQANSIYIGIPGLAPEEGLEVPVDPLLRPYKWAVELFTGAHIGAMDGSLFRPENAEQLLAYREQVRKRWEGFDDNSVLRSIAFQSVAPPLPVMATAGGALLGQEVRGYGDVTQIPEKPKGFTESTARNPFRGEIFGLHESAQAEYIVRALGANAMYMAYNIFMDSKQRAEEGQSAGQISKNAVQTIAMNTKDTFKSVPGPEGRLLGGFAAVSPSQESAGTLVKSKVDGLKALNEAYQATVQNGVPTGGMFAGSKQRGYQPLVGGDLTVGPPDQGMAYLAQMAHQYYTLVDKQFLGPNKDLYQQRQSIQLSTKYSPEMKRAMANDLGDQIIENNRKAVSFLQQMEAAMSSQLGYKVRLDKLNIGQPITQFDKNLP